MRLEYFTKQEFDRDGVSWWPLMNPRVLIMLDVFRHMRGAPVEISPHRRALGRPHWPNQGSDHAIDARGTVDAADVLPAGMTNRAAAERDIDLAVRIGFTAIGYYPHWQPTPGLHLGVRPGRRMGKPAMWGAINLDGVQTYVSLDQALSAAGG